MQSGGGQGETRKVHPLKVSESKAGVRGKQGRAEHRFSCERSFGITYPFFPPCDQCPRDGERLASILRCAAPRVGSNHGAVKCVAKTIPLCLADEPAQGFYGGLGADAVHF